MKWGCLRLGRALGWSRDPAGTQVKPCTAAWAVLGRSGVLGTGGTGGAAAPSAQPCGQRIQSCDFVLGSALGSILPMYQTLCAMANKSAIPRTKREKKKTNQKAWKLQNMKVLFETPTLIPQGISYFILLSPTFPQTFGCFMKRMKKNLRSSILDWKLLSFSLPQDIFDSNKLHEKSVWDFLIFSLSWPIIVSSFNTLWGQQCNKWMFGGSLHTWSSDAAAC